MTIDDFSVSSEVIGIFKDRMISDLETIVLVLEGYKFKTRSQIIEVLNKNVDVLETIRIGHQRNYVQSIETVQRDQKYRRIEEKYGILINVVDEKKVEIVSSFTHKYTLPAVEIALDAAQVGVVFVTPFNFKCLAEEPFEYDASIAFKRLVLECINRKGTDLHLTVKHVNKKAEYVACYRRDGYLCDLNLIPIDESLNERMVRSAVENLSNRDAIDLTVSAGIATVIPDVFSDKSVELRLAAHKVKDGYDCVCRIQRSRTIAMRIDELGFPEDVQRVLVNDAKKRSGITLITGPIRTGKNTTAFAIANEMSLKPMKLKSIESPIEALMPFPQVDYQDNVGALEDSVRLAKKQDLDAVFLNEIPTSSVAFAVKDLVNSSVHVITTMHVNRLWHLPYKLHEYYHDEYKDIISQINLVVNQKMFGVMCPNCAKDMLVADIPEEYSKFLQKYGVTHVGISEGCKICTDTETSIKGNVLGRNQPYVEYIVFDDYVKSSLLACDYPYQMEKFLKDYLFSNKRSLEFTLAKAIADKKLQYEALDSIM